MILLKKCLNGVYANSAGILNDKSAISLAMISLKSKTKTNE